MAHSGNGDCDHILLSVFTCAPGRGSETGVAWNWVLALARRGVALTVVTQERNRAAIEEWRAHDGDGFTSHVRFIYVSLLGDGRIPFGTAGHYLYYYVWQVVALFSLLRSGAWRPATVIHHLVYGGINTGSLLFLLPRPFLFGPMGGGEAAPLRFIRRFGTKLTFLEAVRLGLILLARFNPVLLGMQWRARRVLAKTPESACCFIAARKRTHVSIEIGSPVMNTAPLPRASTNEAPCRIMFAGRLIYWKGAEILADALLRLDQPGAGLEVTVIGTGARASLVGAAFAQLRHIPTHLPGAVPQGALFNAYREADLFVFPSLHDSSGNVVLEAMTFGLPVICLGLGGPPLLVGDAGVVVPARDLTYAEMVDALAAAIRRLADDPLERARLATAASARARTITWDAAVNSAYGPLLPPSSGAS